MLIPTTTDKVTIVMVDDSELIRRDDHFEDEYLKLDATEYCMKGCVGNAHITNKAQGDGCFCELHVHRSVNGTIKKYPESIGAEQASFG